MKNKEIELIIPSMLVGFILGILFTPTCEKKIKKVINKSISGVKKELNPMIDEIEKEYKKNEKK